MHASMLRETGCHGRGERSNSHALLTRATGTGARLLLQTSGHLLIGDVSYDDVDDAPVLNKRNI